MEERKKFIINVAFYGIILLIFLLVCRYVLPVMTPFIIGFCIAGTIHICTRKLKIKREGVRRLLVILICAALYTAFFLGSIFTSAKLVSEFVDIIKRVPSMVSNTLLPLVEQGADWLETAVKPHDTMLATGIDEVTGTLIKSLSQFVTNFSAKAILWATSSAKAIPSLIVSLVVTVVSTFFLLIDFERITSFLMGLIPTKQRDLLRTSLGYAKTMMVVYVKSYSLLFLLTFAELSVGLLILGVPRAVLIALMIAILDVLPILGTGTILLPWALIMLFMANYKMAIGLLVIYLVITGLRNTLEPRIVGKQIGLHPLATLVAMILGLRLFGFLGMIGLPVALMVLNAMRHSREKAAQS